MKTHERRPDLWRRSLAFAISIQIPLGMAFPVQAAPRRGEPEANPQFQEQLRGSREDGALLGGEPMLPTQPQSSGGVEAEMVPPRSVSGVQIGAVAPPRRSSTAGTSPMDTRVTVRVKGAPLATFLDTISAQAKVNFIITEGLENKRITAFLQNVTVREALQVLLEIKGLTYQQIGNTTIGSDGSSSQRIGNTYINSDGTSSQQIGNLRINSDGTSSQRIGNIIIRSDGTSCQIIGNQMYCN